MEHSLTEAFTLREIQSLIERASKEDIVWYLKTIKNWLLDPEQSLLYEQIFTLKKVAEQRQRELNYA